MSPEDSTTSLPSVKSTYKNLFILGFAFFCNFTAFSALNNLQSSIHEDKNIGLASLSVIYASIVISCLFIPPVFINKWGYKYTVVCSISGYILYTVAHLYPTWWLFMTVSVIIGLCAAPLWNAKASYLTTIALRHASFTKKNKDAVITSFFSIFFMMFQLSQVSGNSISSLILKETFDTSNSSNGSYICGSAYCPSTPIVSTNQQTEHSTVVMLIAIYIAFGGTALVSVLLFLDNIKMENEETNSKDIIKKTIRGLRDWRMVFLMPVSAYTGMASGFVSADFTEAYVTCSIGIQKVGLMMIIYGASNSVSSYVVGAMTKLIGRPAVICGTMVFNIVMIAWLHHWEPVFSHLYVFFLTACALGMIDAVWQTQTNAYFAVLFHSNKEIAFSINQLFRSFGYTVAFAYGDYLCVSHKLYILVCVLIISVILYGVVEFTERKNAAARGRDFLL